MNQISISMTMTTEILNEKDFYRTADLALATAIFLFHPLETIDRPMNSRKAFFVFKRNNELDEFIGSYWQGELKVAPQTYFNALRAIKARLYGDE